MNLRKLLRLSGHRPVLSVQEIDGMECPVLGSPRYYALGIRVPRLLWLALAGLPLRGAIRG